MEPSLVAINKKIKEKEKKEKKDKKKKNRYRTQPKHWIFALQQKLQNYVKIYLNSICSTFFYNIAPGKGVPFSISYLPHYLKLQVSLQII